MSIKTLNVNKRVKFVSIQDDAIDREKSNLDMYQKRYSEAAANKHLVFKEGESPTWFEVQVLDGVRKGMINDAMDEYEYENGQVKRGKLNLNQRAVECMKYSLVNVVNGPQVVKVKDSRGIEFVPEDYIRQFPDQVIMEVGGVIWKFFGEADEDEKKE